MSDIEVYVEMKGEIAALAEIERQIALIATVPEAKGKRDEVEAFRVYAKQSNQIMSIQNRFAEMRLRLERKTGELLIDMGVGAGNPQLAPKVLIGGKPCLRDLGISRGQSRKWQKIAQIPLADFEGFLTAMREGIQEITTAAALKLYRVAASVRHRDATMQRPVESATDYGEILLGKMEEILPGRVEEFANLIVTDPPFGLGETADIAFTERENLSKPAGDWDDWKNVNVDSMFDDWARMFRRAITPDGSLCCFAADVYVPKLCTALERHGFIIRGLLVWHKTNPPPSVRESAYRSNMEYIIYATAGEDYVLNWLGQARMLKCQLLPICGGKERLDHPTQKPVALLKTYIEASSNPGDVVLDPFAGVGSTGVAAKELGRRYVLIERDGYHYRQACLRLQATV